MPILDFHRRFRPLTAHPFDKEDCAEHPPCAALRPYVRCFWGPVVRRNALVVPDACADIIIRADERDFSMAFCPVDNTPFSSLTVTDNLFAVRFYFWALPFFCTEFSEACFPDLRSFLMREGFLTADFAGRQAMMERYLLLKLAGAEAPGRLLEGVHLLLATHGRMPLKDVAARMTVSTRTAERMFRSGIGLTPKETADVIRYQTLWRRSLTQPRFDLMEQVEALGFCDQAHLLNTFRRFHSLPLQEAVRRAKDVAFLQDKA